MAYRLKLDHPLCDEVPRIAASQLNAAAAVLRRQPDGPHAAIHDARKHIKRVRALYRLAARSDPRFRSKANGRLSEIAVSLARLRDAAAIVETASYLAQTEKSQRGLVGKLREALIRRRDLIVADDEDLADRIETAAAGLEHAAHDAAKAKLPKRRKKAMAALARAWVRTSRDADDACRRCQSAVDETPFHDLRKRCQDRWMQASLLEEAWPVGMTLLQKGMKKLIDTLGHEHDLAVLATHIEELAGDGLDADDIDKIAQLIHFRRQSLQGNALKAARRVFDGDPEAEGKRIARLLSE